MYNPTELIFDSDRRPKPGQIRKALTILFPDHCKDIQHDAAKLIRNYINAYVSGRNPTKYNEELNTLNYDIELKSRESLIIHDIEGW
jgi:hypothetical protein